MKKPFRLLLCLALLFVSGCCGCQKTIVFGAADIGGIYYTFANTFTGLASSEDDTYQFEVKTTAGSAANLRLLSGGYIELGLAQSDLIASAYEGSGIFEGEPCQGYSAIAGAVGGGGLGGIAINYGYYRYESDMMFLTVAILVIIVQIIQEIGMKLARVSDKRIR